MKKTKYHYFYTIEKEEEWLNNWIKKGWQLTGPVGYFKYKFQDTTEKKQVIRIDVREFKTKASHEEYLQFMKDSGWIHIKGYEKDGKQYFIGNSNHGKELFSDNQSKYERTIREKNKLDMTNVLILIFYLIFFYSDKDKLVFSNIKNAFLTPGIWSKQGSEFIRAFLFEFPFATLRILLAFAPLILMAYLIYQSYLIRQVANKYKKTLNK